MITSPVDDFISNVAGSSRGRVLVMLKGIRSGLPATANAGTSKLSSSTSGNAVSDPTGTAKTGTFRIRNRIAATDGDTPEFQSPSLTRTTARR